MRALPCAVSVLLLFPPWMWANGRKVLVADDSSQAIQNARADADNLSRMRDTAMVQRFVRGGYLVSVPFSTRYYYLHGISSPYRYSRPWTKLFLQRLSRQYYARFKRRLRVTSMVRTRKRQMVLARYNGNAADAVGALRSSHLTGATLDISKHSMSPQARRWMRKVLYSLRKQGYLYAIEEFEQPTFHIMVYASYPEYVARMEQRDRTPKLASGKPLPESEQQ
jgi:hypothetical protein